jgi:hypothetical protein
MVTYSLTVQIIGHLNREVEMIDVGSVSLTNGEKGSMSTLSHFAYLMKKEGLFYFYWKPDKTHSFNLTEIGASVGTVLFLRLKNKDSKFVFTDTLQLKSAKLHSVNKDPRMGWEMVGIKHIGKEMTWDENRDGLEKGDE